MNYYGHVLTSSVDLVVPVYQIMNGMHSINLAGHGANLCADGV
jgi:hypothetical protein